MLNILFVDDEPKVLAGLRRMLRRYRSEWEMEFAEGGEAALELLQQRQFDVVVSDMRMPKMDGAALLRRVQDEYPSAIRIILSGHSDKEHTMRAVGPAHQYLAKPCDPEVLRRTIVDTCALRDRIDCDAVRNLIGRIDQLPTLPDVYRELVAELDSPAASIARAGEIVASDVSVSAKILQLVNSSFFGLPVHVTDLPHAVALLGLDIIKPLVLSTGLFQQFQSGSLGKFSLAGLVDHCMEVGLSARCIAQLEGASTDTCDHAFMAGMLHDLGQLIIAQSFPAQYDHVRDAAAAGEGPLHELEMAEFEASHADVGSYLLGLWGLPVPVVEAVAWHHDPQESSHHAFTPLAAVHVSEEFLGTSPVGNYEGTELSHDFIERIGLESRIKVWANALGVENVSAGE